MTADTSELSGGEHLIRLPRSCGPKANGIISCEVLFRVEPGASAGLGFHGKFMKPGATVPESSLRPSPEFPPTPVVLEFAGRCGHETESLHVLWLLRDRQWFELGRAQSKSWEWAIDLRPIAVRALAQQADPGRVDILTLVGRLNAALDFILSALDPDDKPAACAILRIAALRKAAPVVLDAESAR